MEACGVEGADTVWADAVNGASAATAVAARSLERCMMSDIPAQSGLGVGFAQRAERRIRFWKSPAREACWASQVAGLSETIQVRGGARPCQLCESAATKDSTRGMLEASNAAAAGVG